jgi:RND family efflux transporter MFP subunit
MITRRLNGALALSLLIGLGACAKEEPPPPPPTVRPVKTVVIENPDIGGTRSFPGRIEAARRVELAFRVPGTLAELPFAEGQEVSEGDVVARLDPTDYQITFNDRKATYDRSKADFERGEKLVAQGTISRRDFDALTANFKSAEAALQAAQQDLVYTRLMAPFDGVLARRYFDNFEPVQAKEAVLALNDTSVLEVSVDIPEKMMQRVRRTDPERKRTDVYATFPSAPGQQFPLTFKEVATRADPKTQTFEVTMTMEPPPGLTILSGMTTTVIADTTRLSGMEAERPIYNIPASAAVGNLELEPRVWIVDQEKMTVSARRVEVGSMVGDAIEVSGGLEPGDRVVVAGAAFLAEGMQVRLMPDVEQPASNLR